jgi:hypothetical protein
VRRGKAIDANDRRVANRAENTVVNHDPNGRVADVEPPTPDRYVVITDAYEACGSYVFGCPPDPRRM